MTVTLNAFGLPDFPALYAARRDFTRASATQVETFVACNRKWFFGWPLQLKTPPTAAMETGTRLHAELEDYFTFKKNRDELSKLAQMGLPHLPERGPGLLVEEDLGFPPPAHNGQDVPRKPLFAAGVEFLGFMDLVDPRRMPERLAVLDHKSVSDLKYMKTPEDLKRSIQMVAYAWNALLRFGAPGSGEIDIRHVYYRTKGAACAVPVNSSIDVEQLPGLWKGIENIVEKMKVAGAATKVEEVEPNYKACGDYGGCPHAAYCPGNTPEKRFSMALSDMLSTPAKPPEVQAAPTTPSYPVAAAVATEAVFAAEGVSDEKIVMARNAVASFPSMPDAVKATALLKTSAEKEAEMKKAEWDAESARIDAQLGAERLAKLRAENEATSARVAAALKAEADAKAKTPPAALASVGQVLPNDAPKADAPPAAPVAEKAKRGRPKKAKDGAPESAPTSAAAVAGFMLLIDCLPMGGDFTSLESVIEEIGAEMAKSLNVPHFLMVDFGKWKGYLVAAMLEKLPEYAGDGTILVARSGEASSVVIEALIPRAALVIRGTR